MFEVNLAYIMRENTEVSKSSKYVFDMHFDVEGSDV